MINNIRDTEKIIGNSSIIISKSSIKNLSGRKSLYVIKNINKGEKFTKYNIGSIRPSFGLHPKHLKSILGRKSKKALKFGQRVRLSFVN